MTQYQDQTAFSDEDFLNLIRLPGVPSLKSSQNTVNTVANYFRKRKEPRWCFYMHGTDWPGGGDRRPILDAAKKLKRHIFSNSWAPYQYVDLKTKDGIDWEKGNTALRVSLHRHSFVPEMTGAFAQTGDQSYLRLCFDLIKSYIQDMPFKLDPRFFEDHDSYFGGEGHNTLAVCRRNFRWVDFMYSGALQVPGLLSDDEVFFLIKHLCFQTYQYYRLVGHPMRPDNHHLVDHGYATYLSGIVFPEFTFSEEMKRYGTKVIHHHINTNLFDDGCYAEHSTKYQYHITFSLFSVLLIANENNEKLLTLKQKKSMSKWLHFFAHACQPDGVLATFGDEQGSRIRYLFETLAPALRDPEITAMAEGLGYHLDEPKSYSAADLVHHVKGWKNKIPNYHGFPQAVGNPSSPSPNASRMGHYPKGGFTFMRNSWRDDSDFAGISHYSESMVHGHTHWDMMSFNLFCGGESLIDDPASFLYQQHRDKGPEIFQRYRGYLYSVQAHNCMIINDNTLKNIEALGHECHWGGEPPRHTLPLAYEGKSFNLLECSHDGYAPFRHRRYFIQLTGLGFATVDIMNETNAEAMRPHEYKQFLHGNFDVKVSELGPLVQLQFTRNNASLCVVPGLSSDCRFELKTDEWLAGLKLKDRELKKGPVVASLVRRHRSRSVFSTFYFTNCKKVSRPRVESLGEPMAMYTEPHSGISAHVLHGADKSRFILISCPFDAVLDTKVCRTDAKLAMLHYNKQGRLIDWFMAGGRYLKANGLSISKKKKVKFETIRDRK
ncbi:heparinase II/III family protein [bacterium AH-315-E10]|nr:heparinase II/III family protein [bacterium AH-315-E10]